MKLSSLPSNGLIARLRDMPFSTVDQWFGVLRVMVILGGMAWLVAVPVPPSNQFFLLVDFLFFCGYSILLYVLILRFPPHLRTLYLIALFLDLIFLYWLVRYTDGLQSEFVLAFFLIIALHSFYFGLRIGLVVVLLSSWDYLLAGDFDFSIVTAPQVSLRLTFFLLVGLSMGLISRKEQTDRERIEKLNQELDERGHELELEKDKLTNIIEGIGAGLVLVDANMRINWANSIAQAWFGRLGGEDGMTCAGAIWGNSIACDHCPTARSFRLGTVQQGEFERDTDSERRSFYRVTSAPMRDESGQVAMVLELVQDITEEKTLQAQLVQSSKLAAIGELASGIAHEINNPLSSIAACAEDLALVLTDDSPGVAEIPDSEIDECVRSIKDHIRRCKRITTSLLNFSRRREPRFEPTDINQLLRNTALFARQKAENSRKGIHFHFSEDLPLVMSVPDELLQVFLNVLINALDFTTAGEAVEVMTELNGPDTVTVRVQDQGCGISGENLTKVFSPFFTTKPPGQGTGLGLAISQRIVQRHRGTIRVESEQERGTTVTITLPVNPTRSIQE